MPYKDLKHKSLVDISSEVDELDVPHDVKDFCKEKNCEASLSAALQIVQRSFTSLEEMHINLEYDDEVDMQMVVIEVKVRGGVDRVLEEYDRYTEKWVTTVSWPERNHFRLLYNIMGS